jgi:large repetitive protein
MTFAANDLGVLGNLAVALGVFTPAGEPNSDWFGDPEASLKMMLASDEQRHALVAFVDEAMGGADRTTDPTGVIWLPIVHIDDPDLTVAITVDESHSDGIRIGVGISVRTASPKSNSSLAIPLFLAKKESGPSVSNPLLLGASGGRIRISTSITIDETPPVAGQARLGAIGIDFDLPTSPGDPLDPVFGISLTGFQLPGATHPRDIRVAADGLDELDDAVLDLILSLVKAQADAAAPGSLIRAVAGLLGLKNGDAIPDFPITLLPAQGVHAIADWLRGVITTTASRNDWIDYLADLFGGSHVGDAVSFDLGGAANLMVGLRVDTGPTGNTRLTPTLGIELGAGDARVEARADLFQVDLVTGSATALPQLGLWAAAGRPGAGHRVLDATVPMVARADTLRLGFALDAQRRLTFVLAADGVVLGTHSYPVLDLTSPDAVMDAVGNTVSDVANQLLAGAGDALTVVRLLLGLDAPAGITPIGLPALMTDPVSAVSGYWRDLGAAPAAMPAVLAVLRNALADASEAASAILGTGTSLDPWRVPLIGPLELEVSANGSILSVGIAAVTSVDTLGQRCTVVETRFAATIAELDLAAKTASLLPGVEGVLSARERGINPPRVTFALDGGTALTASGVGLQLGWSPDKGLVADVHAPNLSLSVGGVSLPIALPVIATDGTVTLPAEAWDGVEALVGYLGALLGGFLGDVVTALGWTTDVPQASPIGTTVARLRLSDLIDDPASALSNWLPQLVMSEVGPKAFSIAADLFAGSGANRGFILGTGHPDDPYRLALDVNLPNLVVWFPPEGLERSVVAAPEELQHWRPGYPGISPAALAAALQAEASVAADVRELVDGRDIAGGLTAMAQRWAGGDGRIVPPDTAPAGVTVDRDGVAAGQLLSQLDLEDLIERDPATTVYVAIGATAWPEAPAGRRVDLTAPMLDASMFAAPAAAVGDWFVALGTRTDCLLAGSATDGTPEQAARLARVLDALAAVSSDIALVGIAGAGHAARLAAQAQAAVTDLITLATPLGAIALTAIGAQPTADALRLLHRLLPPVLPVDAADPEAEREDEDLALGRALVGAMMELVDRVDPAAELRPPSAPLPTPRAGLSVHAVFGVVSESQVSRAITAIVAAGLAERARVRAATPLPDATGLRAGVRLAVAPTTSGSLSISGEALVTLFAYDTATGASPNRHLQVRLRVGDRAGWLSATPELELRMVTADISVPLDGSGSGQATVTLHDARVFGQSWERLVLGNIAGAVPVLPEARVLLAAAIQRVTADIAGTASVALAQLLSALGIIDPSGGVAGDAVDQLVHDPGGLIRQRLEAQGVELSSAVDALLGPLGASVDLDADSVRVNGGSNSSGRFGWHADVTASPAGLSGQLRFGADTSSGPTGRLNFVLDLNPLHASILWQQPGGTTDTVTLWPSPDAAAIARVMAKAAPSLGGHAALELMRRADDTARPVIDAALDAMGMLAGAAGDAHRAIRPLAGLLADPAGWLRNPDSLAANPAKIQALFDALRPLIGVAGAPGSPIALANGVTLAVVADGPGTRLTLDVTPTAWAPPGGATGRLAAGLGTSLTVGPSGPPVFGLEAHVGLTGAASGRQAVHLRLGVGGAELFLRPTTGSDIPLVPFAGLGALAAAAEAALSFLLDQLAGVSGTVGDLVQRVGDAFNLRSGTPRHFDGALLHTWATNPVGALTAAASSIAATGLTTIAPLLDAFVPATVTVTATSNTLTVTIGDVSLSWNPASGVASLVGDGIDVPGLDQISFIVSLSASGLDELSVTVGPADIDAGGVTLRPFVTVAAGLNLLSGPRIALGLALDDTHRFAARWLPGAHQFDLVASDGNIATAVDATEPGEVALRIVEVVADLVTAVAMAQQAVQDLLDTAVGATTARNLMRGVVLQDVGNPTNLISGLFDPSTLLGRIHRLFTNLAGAGISITVEGLKLSFTTANGIIGLQAELIDRLTLVTGDVMLWLENQGSWILNNEPPKNGLFVGFLPTTLPLAFTPSLGVYGVGLRIGKNSGPLLDFGLTLESIALHAFAEIDASGARGGGVELQFSNLAVSAAGATGDNGIAQGIMRDTGPTPPKPAFSPALAIQKHDNDPVSVTLRAGDGSGPWWIAIQRGFGPLYLEQIGFGATMPSGRVERISLLMDGSVSMFGLTCAVDDLQITYITSNGDFFNPANWAVDLAGLAVSADMAGVTIAGGLLKQTTGEGIEYLGMLLGRFGVYGLTIFGGYGEGVDGDQKFTAFFAIGAVNGPIGGPPAFFLTGIGGGFGINRRLIVPTDLSTFGNYPLIQALDIAAQPQEPMAQLRALGQYFPMQKGTFWFAAGLSFNSFALVDGIAVVAVQIGDGLDINLLGLARMALPRPQVALVSIEVALLVHFSSSEGVLWVQGQLTDNSWLLYPDIKLTGGFAFVIWFKGEHSGEFALTLGGYHPDFHRDGYPQVPRLGLRWSIGDAIVIKSGSYFALTSEALMAGGDFEASAHFGPAWAEVKFGAHGIVYFDPFHYQVNVYARIAAGVTIDLWIFGEVTISISIGARIDVTGPDFHGRATFEIGPIELTVEFGGSDKAQKQPLAPSVFIEKYLEAAESGGARAHAVITSFGALPAKGEDSTPDGSAARPFIVVVEFGLTFTSTVPATSVTRTLAPANATTQHAPSRSLGVAPMNASNVLPTITLEWRRGAAQPFPFVATPRPFGSFPVGVWGLPQDPNNRKIPKAEMIEALNELDLVCRAAESPGGPEIPYYQVEIGLRKPLPFTRRAIDAAKVKTQARAVTDLVTQPVSVSAAFAAADTFLAATATPTTLAAMRGERQSPPLLGTLTEGIEQDGATVIPGIGQKRPKKVYDHFIDPPVAVGLLSGATVDLRVASSARTTVKASAAAWRVSPPTFAAVEAARSRSIAARLVVTDAPAVRVEGSRTMIGFDVPPTAIAHAGTAVVARTGAPGTEHLASFTEGLAGARQRTSKPRAARGTAGATLAPGQVVVLKMPNAQADAALEGERPRFGVAGAPARVVVLGHGGVVLTDRVVTDAAIEIERGAERIVAIGQSRQEGSDRNAGLEGWHAGRLMPYAGWSTAVAPGCVVRSTGDPLTLHRERLDAGWVSGAELARGVTTVTTTFAGAPTTVVIVLDDPAAFGDTVGGRTLLLGLDGATRARDAAGRDKPPVLLATENRSVLAYDIVPERNRPVVVTIASETGWSLVGVMGSAQLDSAGAIALISARGLDAAIQPLASKSAVAGDQSVLRWLGPTRTPEERQVAKLRAGARPLVPGAKAERPKDEAKSRPKRRTPKPVTKTSKAKSASKKRNATSRSKAKKGGGR